MFNNIKGHKMWMWTFVDARSDTEGFYNFQTLFEGIIKYCFLHLFYLSELINIDTIISLYKLEILYWFQTGHDKASLAKHSTT